MLFIGGKVWWHAQRFSWYNVGNVFIYEQAQKKKMWPIFMLTLSSFISTTGSCELIFLPLHPQVFALSQQFLGSHTGDNTSVVAGLVSTTVASPGNSCCFRLLAVTNRLLLGDECKWQLANNHKFSGSTAYRSGERVAENRSRDFLS